MDYNPTRITENTATLLDHILINSTEKISQFGVLDIGLSDHQIIFAQGKQRNLKLTQKRLLKFDRLKIIPKKYF